MKPNQNEEQQSQQAMLVMQAKANFYMGLVENLSLLADKLGATPASQPTGLPEQTKNDFLNESLTFQVLAQSNVSKTQGFSLDVKVAPGYAQEAEKFNATIINQNNARQQKQEVLREPIETYMTETKNN